MQNLIVLREVTGADPNVLEDLRRRDYITRQSHNAMGTPDSEPNQWHSMQVFVYPPGYRYPRPTEEADGRRFVPVMPGDRVFIDNDHPFSELVSRELMAATRGFALASTDGFQLMVENLSTIHQAENARLTARIVYSVSVEDALEADDDED